MAVSKPDEQSTKPKGLVIGAGRMAQAFCHAMVNADGPPMAVHARRPEAAAAWTKALGLTVYEEPAAWPKGLEWVFLAVADQSLPLMPALLSRAELDAHTLVWHAAGAVQRSAVEAHAPDHGYQTAVAWPMMSFAGGHAGGLDWKEVPWCLEGESEAQDRLEALLGVLGGRHYRVDPAQRMRMHMAAVWANNFPTYCFGVAAALLREAALPHEVMLPIVRHSAARLQPELDPFDQLTGPAIRRDRSTMQAHLSLLAGHPDWAELYRSLSAAIADTDASRKDA